MSCSVDTLGPTSVDLDELRRLRRARDQMDRERDIHEDDELNEEQLRSWVEQASKLPGEDM
ncbi:MAG: hypothetical protein ACLFRT_14755 [Actinomycetota bacterium]